MENELVQGMKQKYPDLLILLLQWQSMVLCSIYPQYVLVHNPRS